MDWRTLSFEILSRNVGEMQSYMNAFQEKGNFIWVVILNHYLIHKSISNHKYHNWNGFIWGNYFKKKFPSAASLTVYKHTSKNCRHPHQGERNGMSKDADIPNEGKEMVWAKMQTSPPRGKWMLCVTELVPHPGGNNT